MRPPIFRASLDPDELVFDFFAGGGGASEGIQEALERPVDIAINHDPVAIAMHRANHPETKHFIENVWAVDPREACGGRRVGVAWFSPDCDHFSRAKGKKPLSKEIRGLANVVIKWAEAVRPRIIFLENVPEFADWGPLDDEGRPDKSRKGEDFRAWLAKLVDLGYRVEYRFLVAADYGSPTTRRRLFLIARCDGGPIVWPEPSHGRGKPLAWRPASEIIDWRLPCHSIFLFREEGRRVNVKRPLAEATLRRIARGIQRFVVDAADPFIIPLTHQGYDRAHSIHEPVRTVTGAHRGELALVQPFITTYFGESVGRELRRPLPTTGSECTLPLPTVTANGRGGGHLAEVRAFLVKFYKRGGQQDLLGPLHTVTSKARFGLVMVHGEPYEIVDVGMRMLAPHELFAAQGFPEDYEIAPHFNGKPLTKTAQISLAGNSVPPQVATALVTSNVRLAA